MELQKIVVLCVVVVLIGAGAWFLNSTSNTGTNEAVTNEELASVTEENASLDTAKVNALTGQGSFLDILALGKSIECTYSYADESGEGSGTGYFDGERMRVDSTFTTDGQTFDSHMINDGENLYTWTTSSEGSFAFVTPYTEYEESETNFDSMPMHDTSGAETLDQRVTYDCDNWRTDESKFVPPSDIEFMDMGRMMQEMMEGMPEGMMENMPQFSQ